MSQLQFKKVSKEIIQRAEDSFLPEKGLPQVVDDYFIQQLKENEMHHADVDPRLYEGLRQMVKQAVVPLYERYRLETEHVRERRQKRKIWPFVLGTVGVCEFLEVLLTKGRAIAPQVLIPSAILYSFIGFIIYTASQYVDDLHLARARRRLERSIEGLETQVVTDTQYDQRRELVDADVLRAEAVEILARYDRPEDFWRDYIRVREADPTVPAELRMLNVPAFERFLRFHIAGHCSEVARQQRFNRLFSEAQEVFVSRDRSGYVLGHLKPLVAGPGPANEKV